MVGSAICRVLQKQSDINIQTINRKNLDLLDQSAVLQYITDTKPDQIYQAAALVGGIHANDNYPADFIVQNLVIQTNVIAAAHAADVQKMLFLGSSCIYPKMANQPIAENELLTGALEPTNEPYGIAKIAGIKLCESYNRQYGRDYRSVMPTNLYGEGDNFHPENSHVIPGMMNRFYSAIENKEPEIVVWGTGKPMREFLYVDDMAEASVHIQNLNNDAYAKLVEPRMSHINVGTGEDCTIAQLAQTLCEVTGYEGKIVFDTSRPDGTPRKMLNVSKIHSSGWTHSLSLKEGLHKTWDWFIKNYKDANINERIVQV